MILLNSKPSSFPHVNMLSKKLLFLLFFQQELPINHWDYCFTIIHQKQSESLTFYSGSDSFFHLQIFLSCWQRQTTTLRPLRDGRLRFRLHVQYKLCVLDGKWSAVSVMRPGEKSETHSIFASKVSPLLVLPARRWLVQTGMWSGGKMSILFFFFFFFYPELNH